MADADNQYLLRERELEVRGIMRRVAAFEPAAVGHRVSRDGVIEAALFWIFVAGLAWAPYWYGSNLPMAWGINAVLFPGLAVIYEILLVTLGASHPVAFKTI